MGETSIEWTDKTWNPVRGCTRVSEGCRNCYAERKAAHFGHMLPSGERAARITKAGPRWSGVVELVPHKLAEPLRWRKPRLIFVNSMSDLFHEALPFEQIAAVFGVMAACPQHVFQVLTKRPERVREFFAEAKWGAAWCLRLARERICEGASERSTRAARFSPSEAARIGWPFPNVWLGTSVENQETADDRIPILLQCPAAVRGVSYEPALGPVDFLRWLRPEIAVHQSDKILESEEGRRTMMALGKAAAIKCGARYLDWVIFGGESGPGARPCDVSWARSVRDQCQEANVAFFMKQVGSQPWGWSCASGPGCTHPDCGPQEWNKLRDRKGGDPAEWPADLRIRQFPEVHHG